MNLKLKFYIFIDFGKYLQGTNEYGFFVDLEGKEEED